MEDIVRPRADAKHEEREQVKREAELQNLKDGVRPEPLDYRARLERLNDQLDRELADKQAQRKMQEKPEDAKFWERLLQMNDGGIQLSIPTASPVEPMEPPTSEPDATPAPGTNNPASCLLSH